MEISVVDYSASTAAQDFANGLKQIGFAVIENHPIDQALIDEAYQAWGAFFNSDEKYQYAFDPKKHDGFISQSLSETAKGFEVPDIKEFYHYYAWGRCPTSLLTLTQTLAAAMTDMAKTLLTWIEEHMPAAVSEKLSMPLTKMIEGSELTLLRFIHYPPLTGNEPAGAVRAAAHEDINLLTVLPSATTGGLQVKDQCGEWLDVPCRAGRIVINAGDMLQECTGHYYPSTTHRVINPEGDAAKQSRLAMPLFLHPRDDVRLSDRYTAGSYRLERYEELGLKDAVY